MNVRALSIADTLAVVRNWIDAHLLAILLLPVFLAIVEPNWFFSNYGLDAWLYHGYFRSLPAYLQTFPDTYYGSRLSVLIPGWICYSLFPATAANILLHVGQFYVCTFSLYFTVKEVAHRTAALLTTILMASHICFLRAVGWDYVDGFGVTYCLLTCALLTRGTRGTRWWLWVSCGGAAATALVIANLAYGLLVPFLVVGYAVLNSERARHSLPKSALSFAGGAVALMGALGTFNYVVAGRFFFFLGTTDWLAGFLRTNKANPWKLPLTEWLPGAYWLYVPACCLAIATLVLLLRYRRQSRFTNYVLLQFILLSAILFIGECRPHGVILQLGYYCSVFLIPLSFIALGSVLGGLFGESTPAEERSTVWLGSGIAVSAIGVAAVIGYGATLGPPLFLFGLVVVGLLGVVYYIRLPRRVRVGLAMVTALAATDFFVRTKGSAVHAGAFKEDMQRAQFDVVNDAVQEIRTVDDRGNMWFLFDPQEKPAALYNAISSTHLHGYRLIGPHLREISLGNLRGQRYLAILTDSSTGLTTAQRTLSNLGLEASLVTQKSLCRSPYAFRLMIVELKCRPVEQLGRPVCVEANPGDRESRTLRPTDASSVLAPSDWKWVNPLVQHHETTTGLEVKGDPLKSTHYMHSPRLTASATGTYTFTLSYDALEGSLAFGALNKEGLNWAALMVDGYPEGASTDSRSRRITVKLHLNAGESTRLLIANGTVRAKESSRFVYRDVRVFFSDSDASSE